MFYIKLSNYPTFIINSMHIIDHVDQIESCNTHKITFLCMELEKESNLRGTYVNWGRNVNH